MNFNFKFPAIALKIAEMFVPTWRYREHENLIGVHPKGVLVYSPFIIVRFPYETGAEKDFSIKAVHVLNHAPKITDELLKAYPVVHGTFSTGEKWPFDRVTLEWAGKPLKSGEFFEAYSLHPIRLLMEGDVIVGSFQTTLEILKLLHRIAKVLVRKKVDNFIAFTIEPIEKPTLGIEAGQVIHYRRAYFAIWDIFDYKRAVVADGFFALVNAEDTQFSKKMADPWVKVKV